MQKQLLDSIAIDKGECLDTEEAIREKIQELNVSIEKAALNSHALIWTATLFVNFSKFGELEISVFVTLFSFSLHFYRRSLAKTYTSIGRTC